MHPRPLWNSATSELGQQSKSVENSEHQEFRSDEYQIDFSMTGISDTAVCFLQIGTIIGAFQDVGTYSFV